MNNPLNALNPFSSLKNLSQSLIAKKISSYELTKYYLARISKFSLLNAFIQLDEENALKAAKQADMLIQKGQIKSLIGIPMAHKDVFCTQQGFTTCGSKMLANFHSPYSATIVKKLHTEGAICLGKTNMDEFCMGSSNKTSYFGPVKNPWNITCTPGGSSGGSAAAVAASLVPFATGSDTGGSIRQPAAFCGVSGIKPTYGLVSRFGMIAYASSLDQAGILARNVEDLAFVLRVMAGFDPKDSTSSSHPIPDYAKKLGNPIRGLKIGLPSCFFKEGIEPDIQAAIKHACQIFERGGASIVEMDLHLQNLWVPCYYVIACAEASSNLSRYDGIRFGYRDAKIEGNLKELIIRARSAGFGEEVKKRIMTGAYVLSSGHFDSYYLQALKVRRLIQQELKDALTQVDFILGPTTPTCAFKLDHKVQDPIQNYLADEFTVAANLAGLPALAIPAGFNSNSGLPIGLQLLGNYFTEEALFNVGNYYQQHTNWHKKIPRNFDEN